MATKIGDLFFDVYADTTKATKSIDGVGSALVKVGATASKAIGETIATATALAVTSMVSLSAATISTGAAYNTLGQSATAAFSTIYDDTEAAYGILRDISELNLETPFKGSAIVRTSRTLAGFGVAEEDVLRTTEALAEAIAGLGLGSAELQRVAIQFGQIESRGRLAGDEARALANYGIDAFGILADQLDLPVQKVREMSEELKLTSDVVLPALIEGMEARFGGATEALFNTAAGQAEGLRSVFEAVGSAIVQPFIGLSSGGAIVDAMSSIRVELLGLVSVAEDGSFILDGFLTPLGPIVNDLADSFARAADTAGTLIASLDEGSLTRAISAFEGLGPLVAGGSAALVTMFAQSIPLLGRFAAGLNPIVVGVGALIATSSVLRAEFAGAFSTIQVEVVPLVPQVKELLVNLVQLAEDAGPAIADILITSIEGLAPVLSTALSAANDLLPVLNPLLVAALEAVAAALQVVVTLLDLLGPEVVTMTALVYGLSVAFPVMTAKIIFATTNFSTMSLAASGATAALGTLAAAIGIVAAAAASYRSVRAGIEGDIGYLSEDVAFYEKPFQLAGRFGFALTGGNRAASEFAERQATAQEAAAAFDAQLLAGVETFAEAREVALQYASAMGVAETASTHFANIVALDWSSRKDALDEERAALAEVQRIQRLRFDALTEYWNARSAEEGKGAILADTAEEIDLLKELTSVANLAWEAVDRLSRAGSGATVDEFLRELPSLAEDLTDALGETPGILQDLNVGGVLEDVRAQAVAIVQSLAKDYELSMGQIRALFDERGLSAVIEALGQMTESTTETIDPLIAKYGQLGATVDQLQDAVAKLNDQRQTAIRAQIDQVEAALRDAKQSAEDAREAVADFLSGSYLQSPQALVDDLIGDVGSIGSAIEDALAQGGVRGEAGVRSALGGLQSQLAEIVNAGIEAGLSNTEIAGLLAPVLAAINEEVGAGANRITSLDFSEGISGSAGQALSEAIMRGMDPVAIQGLISDILGADATVAGLENRLEGLKASLDAEVEFSAEQVQAALDEITAETTVTPIVTPEAAQRVFDEIQSVLADEDLAAAVDQAVLTQQIVDAAKEAENQVNLVFDTSLAFDSTRLQEVAALVGEEFHNAFNTKLNELRDERAQAAGFESASAMTQALGPAVSDAILGGAQLNQTINNDITIEGAQEPLATASEVIAASSAAAGSGGQYDPSKYYRGGPR